MTRNRALSDELLRLNKSFAMPTRSAMFRDLSFLPGLPAVSFDIPRFAGDSLGQT